VAFREVEFPRTWMFKSKGGPAFSTSVNEGFSGAEFRNQSWLSSRAEYTASLMTPVGFSGNRQTWIDALLSFFYAIGAGRANGFRVWDPLDNVGKNQALATVNGQVQIVKNYILGAYSYQRVITKPIGTGVIDFQGNALANTVFLHGTNTPVTVDSTTGIVTGQSAGTAVDFSFHVPVRFDSDLAALVGEPSSFASGKGLASLNTMKMIEVRPPNY
jgi:uncharacterized protein (TIGR02217 family)